MPKDVAILQSAKEPKVLVDTACEFAASNQPHDLSVLFSHLDSREFLLKLNTEQEYVRSRAKGLKVARVVKALMDSPHGVAKPTLVALTKAGNFLSFELLQELLVRALAAVRPSPPDAIAYWDRHSQPDSSNLHLVIEAIFANGSDPALALFERKLNDPRQEIECKTIWLRDPLLRHRNDPPVLRCCERMVVQGSVPEPLRPLVVEAVCGYEREWYLACKKPRPPLRALATPEAREILRRICEFADEKMKLEPAVQIYLETTMRELGLRRRDRPPEGTA